MSLPESKIPGVWGVFELPSSLSHDVFDNVNTGVYSPFMSLLQFPGSNCSSQQSTDGTYCASTNLMAEVASTRSASQSGRKAPFTAMVVTAAFLSPLFYDIALFGASIEGSAIAAVPSLMMP